MLRLAEVSCLGLRAGGDDLIEDRLIGQCYRIERRQLSDPRKRSLDERALDDRAVAARDGVDVEVLYAVNVTSVLFSVDHRQPGAHGTKREHRQPEVPELRVEVGDAELGIGQR